MSQRVSFFPQIKFSLWIKRLIHQHLHIASLLSELSHRPRIASLWRVHDFKKAVWSNFARSWDKCDLVFCFPVDQGDGVKMRFCVVFDFFFCHTDNVIKSGKKNNYSLLLEVISVKQHMTGGFAKSAILPQDSASVVKNTHEGIFPKQIWMSTVFLKKFFINIL